jgi:predicted ATPase/signal transduction histidine kinase
MPGYEARETLSEHPTVRVVRGRDTDGKPVVLKQLAADAGAQARSRFRHEYEMLRRIDLPGVVKALALEGADGGLVMVLEDIGGDSLERMLAPGEKMPVRRFLDLALGLAGTLCTLHRLRIVHKDVNPFNVVVNVVSGEFRLIGFGVADELPQSQVANQPAAAVEGNLAYIAPEQTGRMNRPVDYRSDYYSLGATFYRLLVGRPPFAAEDVLGLVHEHIAVMPPPPHEIDHGIPVALSRIVMKLLAKVADDRYQSGSGLIADLERCRRGLAAGVIPDFEPGQDDFSDRLQLPEKLYGREREMGRLLAAFARARAGGRELQLLAGYAGVGKTALVREACRAVAGNRGFFIEGKFDPLQRGVPYLGWIQAFSGFVRYLLMDTETQLAHWRHVITAAVGNIGRVLTDVIPGLELVIGAQPEVPALTGVEAENRFNYVFLKLVGAIATPDAPLVIFLDDLQWIDAASLKLLRTLLMGADAANVLVIGAYRDNEVDALHPLTTTLEGLRREKASVEAMIIGGLTEETVNSLIADALYSSPARTVELSRLLCARTGGNPFFLRQTLKALAEKQALVFNVEARRWQWDIAAIEAMGVADNVVTLMLERIRQLTPETQRLLSLAACIGFNFSLADLGVVAGRPNDLVPQGLQPALHEGLIVAGEWYQFAHDRVREAAYSLIPTAERPAQHLQIGRLLLAHTPEDALSENIFEIVGHLNQGMALITLPSERERLAELNLLAGKRAKAATAFASALAYLSTGTLLLADDCWERRHELVYSLEINRAECEFLTGDREAAEQRLTVISEHAADTVEQAAVACLRIDLYTTLDQSNRAIAAGLDFLRRVGIDCQPHPSETEVRREYERIKATLGGRAIEELLDLLLMSDPASLATVEVLTKIWPPALFRDANLASLMICKAVSLSLERGNCGASCFAYALLGRIAGPSFGDYQAGFRFGQLGYELLERRGMKRFEARTVLCFANSIVPWMKHVRTCRDMERRAFEAANRAGDLLYGAFACNSLNTDLLFAGSPLPQVQSEAERGLKFAEKARFGLVIDSIAAQLALIRTLRGLTPEFGRFDDGQFDELRIEEHFAVNPALAIAACRYWIRKLQARYFVGDYAAAVDAASKAQQLLWTKPLAFEEADYHFYGALARAAYGDRAPDGQREPHLAALTAHHKQLEIWSENCPENFENRAALVGAEIARVERRDPDAMRLYEKAIASARQNEFVHNEAVAHEAAAAFYRDRGFERFARIYLAEAVACFAKWGADGKVRQLERLHPWLVASKLPETVTLPERLDALSLARAQQAISGEILMDRLAQTLLRIVVENAGAQKGCLAVEGGSQLMGVVKRGDDEAPQVVVDSAVSGADIPETLVNFVRHSRETVILADASTDAGEFSVDEYFRRVKPKSVLCMAIQRKDRLLAVLYLENNLAANVFSAERLELLKALASQSAISMENAGLYQQLEARVAERTAQLEAANKELEAFAYSVSHDLRAPLRHIDGFVGLLRKKSVASADDAARHYMDRVSETIRRMGALIDDLLSFSRMGRAELVRTRVDLGVLVKDVIAELEPETRGRSVRWAVAELPVVTGDRAMLRVALANLASNAVKFSQPRERAEIEIGSLPGRENETVVFIRDNGVGFDPQYADKLFGVFQRLHGASEFEGTGIGLANVRRIVARHGGRTWAEGKVDGGATFYFSLPRQTERDNKD